jgi:inner membrane transporter RhtA
MNCCFYLAIDRLPLGTVAAIKFLPVIVLAVVGACTLRNGLALALAVPGVYLSWVEAAGVALVVAGVVVHRAPQGQGHGRSMTMRTLAQADFAAAP